MDDWSVDSRKKWKLKTFQEDEVILREGEVCGEMYKIISGSVAVYNRYGERDEHLIGIYSKGRCFGELNVLSDLPGVYTVVAYNEVLVMRITKDALEEFIRTNPRNVVDMLQNMAHTIRVMQRNISFLLDDFSGKMDDDLKRSEEIRQKIMQYGMMYGGTDAYRYMIQG